jgi:hypothetical protein
MKRLKQYKEIKKNDYIKAINNRGKYIIFNCVDSRYPNTALIVDTNIAGLETMIGKTESLSKFSLMYEF